MTGITTVLVVVMSQASHSAVALKGYETRAEGPERNETRAECEAETHCGCRHREGLLRRTLRKELGARTA